MGCRPTQRLGPEDRLKRSSEALLEKLDQRATQNGMKWGRRRADKLGRRRTGTWNYLGLESREGDSTQQHIGSTAGLGVCSLRENFTAAGVGSILLSQDTRYHGSEVK